MAGDKGTELPKSAERVGVTDILKASGRSFMRPSDNFLRAAFKALESLKRKKVEQVPRNTSESKISQSEE